MSPSLRAKGASRAMGARGATPALRRTSRVLGALVAVVLATGIAASFAVTGPRGSGDYPTGRAADLVAGAPAATSAAGTAAVQIDEHVDTRGPGGALRFGESGVIEPSARLARISADLGGLAPSDLGIVRVGPLVFFAVPRALQARAGSKPWLQLGLGALSAAPGLSTGADVFSPLGILAGAGAAGAGAAGAAGAARAIGHADTSGVATSGFEIRVDISQSAVPVPALFRRQLSDAQTLLRNRVVTVPPLVVDVWIDGAGVARRMSWIGRIQTVTMSGRIDFAPGGAAGDIVSPPRQDVAVVSDFEAVLRLLGFGR